MSSHRGASSFAEAAKVLFDSAAKVGAVEPLGIAGKKYAQQLKKIQNQSKRKGGSLGSVSYKVAEFLYTNRTPRANIAKENFTTIAKHVPLIDVPQHKMKKNMLPPVQSAKPSESPSLAFVLKTHERIPQSVQSKGLTVEFSVPHVPKIGFLDESKKTNLKSTASSSSSEERKTKDCEILSQLNSRNSAVAEMSPIFKSNTFAETRSLLFTEETVQPPTEAPSLSRVQLVPPPTLSPPQTAKTPTPTTMVPISSSMVSSTTAAIEFQQDTTISVDVWEMQREREIEQVRKNQEELERRRLMSEREEEFKTLGEEWIRHRTEVQKTVTDNAFDIGANNLKKLYFANQWEVGLHCFEQIAAASGVSTSTLRHAAGLMEKRLNSVPLTKRDLITSTLIRELNKRNLQDDVIRLSLRHQRGSSFLEAYRSAPERIKDHLGFDLVCRTIPLLTRAGYWEEAMELMEKSGQRFNNKSGVLEIKLLESSKNLTEEARKTIIDRVSKNLTSSSRLSVQHKILLAKMHKGAQKRQMLTQLINANDVDESVYAELILATAKEKVKDVLDEIEKRGLSREDPAILGALCWKAIDEENPQSLFLEIARQETIIGIRPVHLRAAIAMARVSKTEETLRSVLRIVKKVPHVHAKYTLRKMLPLLHDKNMTREILELADLYSDFVPLENAIPNAVAFINNALQEEGREPLSDSRVSTLIMRGEKSSPKGAASSAFKRTNFDISTEQMLQYAKERNWAKALEVVKGIPDNSLEDMETVTLFYNCAMSACVDKVDIAHSLYNTMVEKSIPINATTNNALLSSIVRSGNTQEVNTFYKRTDSSSRDINTYSIMLSFLGKVGLWKEAEEVFQDARAGSSKLPPMVYALAIGALNNHTWSGTWDVFQDLIKEHGSQNVKEVIVNKVVRCLTQHKRTAELQKLETELLKKKKKKQ